MIMTLHMTNICAGRNLLKISKKCRKFTMKLRTSGREKKFNSMKRIHRDSMYVKLY